MASIKERAAALNLEEKLCVRPPDFKCLSVSVEAPGVPTKPVQSSCMWSSLISHLRSTVTVKRRLVHLKSHSDCFLGSEAVDVLVDHITQTQDFQDADVSRDKVVCVCQTLLECKVFEAVGTKVFGKDKKRNLFQDSKNALYRFSGMCTPSVDELEKGALVNGIQKLFCSASSDRQEVQTCPSGSHAETSTPFRLTLPSTKARQPETPGTAGMSAEPLTDNQSPMGVQIDSDLPQSLVDEVGQQQTLLRLLTIVELPLLDGVLQCINSSSSPSSSNPPTYSNPDLICSSNHLNRQILKAFKDSQEDEWLCAALDCLDFLPDQLVVELSRELPHCFPKEKESNDQEPTREHFQEGGHSSDEPIRLSPSGLAQWKMLLYGTLVKHYNSNGPPLLPQCMTDVYAAIINLLMNAKLSESLEALQLCLKLLPRHNREELRRLLTFMSLAADPQEVKLDKEMGNRLAVRKAFSGAILQSKTLSKENEGFLIVFMLCNVEEIFMIPGALHKAVSEKLAGMVEGKPPDVMGVAFCQQVFSTDHVEIAKNTTNQELWGLLNNIHLDTKISAKERKRLLKQFYQAHPQIFNQYFGDSPPSFL